MQITKLHDRLDEQQEFELGRLLWIRQHPECPDGMKNGYPEGNLKGYRRLKLWRRREARWNHRSPRTVKRPTLAPIDRKLTTTLSRATMIDYVFESEPDLDFEQILIREILAKLPLVVRTEVLRALAGNDGRTIRRAARLIQQTCPDITKMNEP